MITFCSDWYFSYIGQNFAATSLLIVMFFARMSVRSPCRSARIAFRTSSMVVTVVAGDVADTGCWAVGQAIADTLNRPIRAVSRRVLRTVASTRDARSANRNRGYGFRRAATECRSGAAKSVAP